MGETRLGVWVKFYYSFEENAFECRFKSTTGREKYEILMKSIMDYLL